MQKKLLAFTWKALTRTKRFKCVLLLFPSLHTNLPLSELYFGCFFNFVKLLSAKLQMFTDCVHKSETLEFPEGYRWHQAYLCTFLREIIVLGGFFPSNWNSISTTIWQYGKRLRRKYKILFFGRIKGKPVICFIWDTLEVEYHKWNGLFLWFPRLGLRLLLDLMSRFVTLYVVIHERFCTRLVIA